MANTAPTLAGRAAGPLILPPCRTVAHEGIEHPAEKEEDIHLGHSFNRILVFRLASSRYKAAPAAHQTKPRSPDGCLDP